MKKWRIFLVVLCLMLVWVIPTGAAPGDTGLNAQFIHWQEKQHVIHLLVFNDHGRQGAGPAMVEVDQALVFGVEWGGDIEAEIFDVTLAIDGGAPFSVVDGYQPAIDTSSARQPWAWDHDADGRGDGDGDGIGDWSGIATFYRYWHPGFSSGPHTYVFTFTFIDGTVYIDTITVQFGP